jgi:hypothetical protein
MERDDASTNRMQRDQRQNATREEPPPTGAAGERPFTLL